MTDLECLTIISLIIVFAVAFGWTLRGFTVDRLRAKLEDLRPTLTDALTHLKSIETLKHRLFHYEVTIKELNKRLSKFQRVRGEKGRFVS